MELNTFTIFLTLGKRRVCSLGRTLQYQVWKAGPPRKQLIMVKLMLRSRSNGIFSMSGWEEGYIVG